MSWAQTSLEERHIHISFKYDGFGCRKLEEKRDKLILTDNLDLEKGKLEYQSPSYLTC